MLISTDRYYQTSLVSTNDLEMLLVVWSNVNVQLQTQRKIFYSDRIHFFKKKVNTVSYILFHTHSKCKCWPWSYWHRLNRNHCPPPLFALVSVSGESQEGGRGERWLQRRQAVEACSTHLQQSRGEEWNSATEMSENDTKCKTMRKKNYSLLSLLMMSQLAWAQRRHTISGDSKNQRISLHHYFILQRKSLPPSNCRLYFGNKMRPIMLTANVNDFATDCPSRKPANQIARHRSSEVQGSLSFRNRPQSLDTILLHNSTTIYSRGQSSLHCSSVRALHIVKLLLTVKIFYYFSRP